MYLFCRETLSAAILRLCTEGMKLKSFSGSMLDWLFVIPLCHFLSGDCIQFQSLNYEPSREVFYQWTEKYGYKDQKICKGYGYS